MINIALFEPEIPPNTGNLIRLCANAGFTLHLIHPLGFSLQEKQLRRAGLDYKDLAHVEEHVNFQAYLQTLAGSRLFACTTKAQRRYSDVNYEAGDNLLFGPESRGLPAGILESLEEDFRIRIPMQCGSRSINLANAVSIIAYEAWRQHGFPGAV